MLPFLVRALVVALRDFPQINARYDDEAQVITRLGAVHVGVATQADIGLMVPVVRHAETRSLWDSAAEISRLANAARTGKVGRDELSGSTITLTSLGALGGIVSTPVLNLPEVAIVGVNKNRRTADGRQRPDRDSQDDEPLQLLRSPRGRWHGRGAIHPGRSWSARTTRNLVCGLIINGADMQILNTTLLIIGGGPGGYVTAIRAGQLGISTILVEGESLGGTCLNIGCIPSKALIHVAEQFHQTQHHSQHSALGISVSAPTLDIGKSVEWKDGIVDRLTTGVSALLKKHKVQVIQGWAKVIDGKNRRSRRHAHSMRAPGAGHRFEKA